jgi:hypothetical protein
MAQSLIVAGFPVGLIGTAAIAGHGFYRVAESLPFDKYMDKAQ